MNFDLSEEQRAIADMAGSVFADYCNDDQIRTFWDSGKNYDAPLWQQLVDTGLMGLIVPEADGGSGLGMLELMLALEQQGRHVAPVPLWCSEQLVAAAWYLHRPRSRVPGWKHWSRALPWPRSRSTACRLRGGA